MGEVRSSRWATVIYSDSCPVNFVDVLKDSHVPFLISPEHNFDTDKDGKPKKVHRHVILYFDSLKSSRQVKEIFDTIGGVGCEKVASATSYARYLCHLDEDDKPIYNTNDVISYGLDYQECIKTSDAKYDGVSGVLDFCLDNDVFSFAKLLIALRKENSHLFKVVVDNSYLVKCFLSSLKQDAFEEEQKVRQKVSKIDMETGEILS